MEGQQEAGAAPLGQGPTDAQEREQEQPSSSQNGQASAPSRNSSRKRSSSRNGSSSGSSNGSVDGRSNSSGGGKSKRSSEGGSGSGSSSSSAGRRKGRKRSSSSGAGGSEGLVLAGEQYTSLLDLRYRMRVLQRQLLGGAGEVEVPRGSPHFDIFQVHAGLLRGCAWGDRGSAAAPQGRHTCCRVPGCRMSGDVTAVRTCIPWFRPPLPAAFCLPLQAVFQLHPGYSQKVREPITSFFVVRNPQVAG